MLSYEYSFSSVKDMCIFVMILRLLSRNRDYFNEYEINTINEMIKDIFYHESEIDVIIKNKWFNNTPLIEIVSESSDFSAESKEENNFDYGFYSRYFVSSNDFKKEYVLELSEKNNFMFSKIRGYKNGDFDDSVKYSDDNSYNFSEEYEAKISDYFNDDFDVDFNFYLEDRIENFNLEPYDQIDIKYDNKYFEQDDKTKIKEYDSDFNAKEKFIEDIVDKKELTIIKVEKNSDLSDIKNENSVNQEYNDVSYKIEAVKNGINKINTEEENKKLLIQKQKESLEDNLLNFVFSSDNFKREVSVLSEVNNKTFYVDEKLNYSRELFSRNDFESEVKPCLDIDFSPKKIDDNKYSLLRGGLELTVKQDDIESNAVFGVRDKKSDYSKVYSTKANEVSAMLFKAFEERGVFLEFEIKDNDIYLKDVSGTRIFMEDNERFSVNNISYKVVIKNKDNNEEIKNVKLDSKLDEGNYVFDVIAEVDYNKRMYEENRDITSIFNKMKKDGKDIRAYCIQECGFETNGKETILEQIINISRENGYNLELETMDTIANNKFRSNSITYVKRIGETENEYLKIHPSAKKDKIGILYLVFDENNKILGEVGYRDEGLNYVARKGLKIKPVIYELGANVKGAYLEKKAA